MPTILFHAATRGKKYEIIAYKDGNDTYTIKSLTHGTSNACSVGLDLLEARVKVANEVIATALYSSINYRVLINELGAPVK